MTAIIKRQILNIHNQVRSLTTIRMCVSFNLCIVQVEEVPHEFFAFTIIGDFLFGDSPGDFPSYLNQEPRLRQLLSEPPSFWTALVGKYFIERPHVIVSGVNLFYMLLVCIHYTVEPRLSGHLGSRSRPDK